MVLSRASYRSALKCLCVNINVWFTRSQTKNTTISLKILWGRNYSNTTITRWHWNITGILALGVGQWTKCAEAASWCCAAGGSASRRVHFWSGLEVKCAQFLILSDYKTFHLSRIHEAGKLLHCIFLLSFVLPIFHRLFSLYFRTLSLSLSLAVYISPSQPYKTWTLPKHIHV